MSGKYMRLTLCAIVVAIIGRQVHAEEKRLPKLVDLGAHACIPCKKMAPLLEEMKKDYAGVFDVVFIDVWKNPAAGKKYGIEQIPTQIFYDAAGKERFRHVGFFSKEDILAKWKELGYDLKPMPPKSKSIRTIGNKEK